MRTKTWSDKNEISRRNENLITLGIGALVFCILIVGGRSLFSGYHFRDDHEVLNYAMNLKEMSFWQLALLVIKNDINQRYRPLYNFTKVLKVFLFGPSFEFQMLIAMIEGIITFWLLSRAFRLLGERLFGSMLVAALILFGRQFQPWFRFLNQENEGMLLCALIFWMIAYGCVSEKGKRIWSTGWFRTCLIVVIALSSMQKEAFLIIIPGWIILAAALQSGEENHSLCSIIKSNLWLIIPSLIILVAGLYIIIEYSGTTTIGYAQVSLDIPLSRYISGFYRCIRGDGLPLNLLLIAGVLLLLVLVFTNRMVIHSIHRREVLLLCAAGWILFSQLVLHAYSGMFTRYLLPYTLGVGIIVYVLRELFLWKQFYRVAYLILSLLALSLGIKRSYTLTTAYYDEGENDRLFLECLKAQLEIENNVVLIDSYLEDAMAITAWFRCYAAQAYAQTTWVEFQDGYGSRDDELLCKTSLDTYDVIVTHQYEVQPNGYWIKEQQLDFNDYEVELPGDSRGYAVLIK